MIAGLFVLGFLIVGLEYVIVRPLWFEDEDEEETH